MNPDRTKGSNFKGVIAYITHDPQQSQTKDRVSFTYCHNLRTQDPEKAAKAMAWTALHASDLKHQAGEAATGRKMEKPVYHLSLNWHPSEKPTQEEMIKAGKSVLEALKMGEHHAVFAAHTDKDHQHLHIVVNRVHPETGTSPSLSNDLNHLQKWAYEYEKSYGKIWCKEREAKYDDDHHIRKAAAERLRQEKQQTNEQDTAQSQKQQDTPKNQPHSTIRQAWDAQKQAAVNTQSQKADAIRTHFAGEAKALSDQSKALYARQRQEKSELYKTYAVEKQQLWKERGKSLSDTYEKTKADYGGEWACLKRQQQGEFASMMRSIRQIDYERQRQKKPLGFLMSLIEIWYNNTLADDLKKQHHSQRQALYDRQKKEQDGKLNERKAYHQAKASYARTHYLEKKKQLEQKQDFERQQIQKRWKKLNEDRAKAWQELKMQQEQDRQKREEEQNQKPQKLIRPSFAQRYNLTVADKRKQQPNQPQGLTEKAMQKQPFQGKGQGRKLE